MKAALLLVFASAFALVSQSGAPEASIAAVRTYYGPARDTSAVDTRTIASARRSIDLAAFILTNRAIRDALTAAARHGVSVDRLLRTGSANYTFSGEHRQDDDVVIVEIVPLATAFVKAFNSMWTQAGNEEIGR